MPSAKRVAQERARQRRSKILLVVLGAVLLGLVGFEATTMLGKSKHQSAETATATTSTAVSTTTGGAAPAATAAPTATAAPAPSQLASFTRFPAHKNPFHSLVPAAATTADAPSPAPQATHEPSGTSPTSSTPAKIPTPPVTLSVQQTTTAATTTQTGPLVPAAVLKLNGTKQVVTVGAAFPAKHPVFKLLAVGTKTLWLQLVDGSLASGSQTIVLHFGTPLKLVNQTAKLSYLLAYLKATVAPPPPPPVRTTPAADSATTTAATTTAQTATVSSASP